MKEIMTEALWVCSCFTTISAALILVIKPIRNRVLGLRSEEDGMKCLLRAEMLRIYYHNREDKEVRQYEYENFILAYKAYKSIGGNSFIDHIKSEVDEWDVVS